MWVKERAKCACESEIRYRGKWSRLCFQKRGGIGHRQSTNQFPINTTSTLSCLVTWWSNAGENCMVERYERWITNALTHHAWWLSSTESTNCSKTKLLHSIPELSQLMLLNQRARSNSPYTIWRRIPLWCNFDFLRVSNVTKLSQNRHDWLFLHLLRFFF